MRTLSRIASGCNQQLPLNDTLIKVEFKKSSRCFSLWRERFDCCSPEDKMIIPPMASWVEDSQTRRFQNRASQYRAAVLRQKQIRPEAPLNQNLSERDESG